MAYNASNASCWLPPGRGDLAAASDADAWLGAAAVTAYGLFGVLAALFGYRCFRAVLFLTGFIFASVLSHAVLTAEHILAAWINVAIAFVLGLVFGSLTLLAQYVGLFVLGLHSGILLAAAALAALETSYYRQEVDMLRPSSPWVSVAFLIALGLLFALLNLCFQKSLTVVGSALYGSAVVTSCLDYFLQSSSLLSWFLDRIRVQNSPEQCWYIWATLATWPLLFALGLISQLVLTWGQVFHESPRHRRRHRRRRQGDADADKKAEVRCKRVANASSREENRQRNYRYLYQIRTCHGDVITRPLPNKAVNDIKCDLDSV